MEKRKLLKKLGFSDTYLDLLEKFERGREWDIEPYQPFDEAISYKNISSLSAYHIDIIQRHSSTTMEIK